MGSVVHLRTETTGRMGEGHRPPEMLYASGIKDGVEVNPKPLIPMKLQQLSPIIPVRLSREIGKGERGTRGPKEGDGEVAVEMLVIRMENED